MPQVALGDRAALAPTFPYRFPLSGVCVHIQTVTVLQSLHINFFFNLTIIKKESI